MERERTDFVRLPELLAPAGSPASLDAAIEAGADAVYFGAGDFNARMRAKNFSDEELTAALRKCAEYGVKTYVTVNTRLRDAELPEALKLCRRLWMEGVSALIVADAGLAALIKKSVPSLEIHASTQMSGHSARDAEELAKMGFSRMVCPREMSLNEIGALCAASPIEIEMFIHGAHCVSFSGQCLMSYAMGGRSGNRGMCAQPCRLPFTAEGVDNSYPLSLKDMCLAGSIREIISSGASSLKIEGRQKSADYVYEVVKIYRRLLDEKRNANADEIRRLYAAFSRSGFTDGYLKGSYRSMLGVRGEDGESLTGTFPGLKRRIPLDASLTVKVGERAKLCVTDGKRNAVSYGGVTERRDTGSAMSYDAAREKAAKLGNTAFILQNFTADIDPDAYFSLSELNSMRRDAVEKMAFPEKRFADEIKEVRFEKKPSLRRTGKVMRTAEFTSFENVPAAALDYFDRIYIPYYEAEFADGEKICISLDPLTYDKEYGEIGSALKDFGGEALVHGFGQAEFARSLGLKPAASFRFNVLNSVCAEKVLEYADCVTVSPEAPSALCRDIAGDSALIVYGRIPLMHTERCFMSDGGAKCPFGGAGGRTFPYREKKEGSSLGKECGGVLCRGALRDRTGADFPVYGLRDCSNVIFNSVPVYMADKADLTERCGASRLHFIFTDETPKECEKVILAYRNGEAPENPAKVRRIK